MNNNKYDTAGSSGKRAHSSDAQRFAIISPPRRRVTDCRDFTNTLIHTRINQVANRHHIIIKRNS